MGRTGIRIGGIQGITITPDCWAVILPVTAVCSLATFACWRHLTLNPDVQVDHRRSDAWLQEPKNYDGKALHWRAIEDKKKTMRSAPLNQTTN